MLLKEISLTPATQLGAAAVAAYADHQGVDVPAFLDILGPTLTPDQVGRTLVDVATDPGQPHNVYLASGERLPVIGLGSFMMFDRGSSTDRTFIPDVIEPFWRGGGRVVETSARYGAAEPNVGRAARELAITKETFGPPRSAMRPRHRDHPVDARSPRLESLIKRGVPIVSSPS